MEDTSKDFEDRLAAARERGAHAFDHVDMSTVAAAKSGLNGATIDRLPKLPGLHNVDYDSLRIPQGIITAAQNRLEPLLAVLAALRANPDEASDEDLPPNRLGPEMEINFLFSPPLPEDPRLAIEILQNGTAEEIQELIRLATMFGEQGAT